MSATTAAPPIAKRSVRKTVRRTAVAEPGLGGAHGRALAARGAQHDVALDGPRLEVQAHRRPERVEPHAPVGERDVGLDLPVGGRLDADRHAAELRVVLAGARDAQPERDAGERQRDDDHGRQEADGEPAAAGAAPGWRSGVHPS